MDRRHGGPIATSLRFSRGRLRRLAQVAAAMHALGLFATQSAIARADEHNPHVVIPPHVMPKVNAYHTWEDAWKMAVDIKAAEEAMGRSRKPGYVETEAEKRERTKLLALNQKTIERIRQGLKQPYVPPRMTSHNQLFPDFAHLRALARLMGLQAEEHLAQGRPDMALETCVDTIEMGEKVSRATTIIGRLVANALDAIGRAQAWHTVDKVGANASRSAALRLAVIDALRAPLSFTLREEMYGQQTAFLKEFKSPSWRQTLAGYFEVEGVPEIRAASKKGLMAEYTRVMKVHISRADRLPPSLKEIEPISRDPFISIIEPIFTDIAFSNASGVLTQTRLLMLEFALRAYRIENSSYPAKLADLVPSYLPYLPRDPFRPKQTFGYVRTTEGHTLYSIGPDGIDQGGKSIVNAAASPDGNKMRVLKESKGDIVAGVNTR